jgi:hypothetical protein
MNLMLSGMSSFSYFDGNKKQLFSLPKQPVEFSRAPEVNSKSPFEGPPVDVFSIGYILFQMRYKMIPFYQFWAD